MRWLLVFACAGIGALLAARCPTRGLRGVRLESRESAAPAYRVTPRETTATSAVHSPPPKRGSTPQVVPTHATWRQTLAEFEEWPHDVSAAQLRQTLRATLARTTQPVRRQYLIFLAVRLLSAADAKALLAELDDPADAEDVLLALAFNGDDEACARFFELAKRPSPAKVAQLVDKLAQVEAIERMGNEDAREILRSYRALEVLTRDFYFRAVNGATRVPYTSNWDGYRAHAEKLLPAWLERYPGHPGSDDVALMIGESRQSAVWLARAAVLPDQRRTSRALRGMLKIVERMELENLDRLIAMDGPHPILLAYVRIRRIAAERSYAEGLAAARAYAREHAATTIGYGWRDRWAAPLPDGVEPEKEPSLRRRDSWGPRWSPAAGEGWPQQLGHIHDTVAAQRSPGDRLHPPREAISLDPRRLAFQFRCWETLAALEKRKGTEFERAKLLLHNPYVLYPVYAKRSWWSDRILPWRSVATWPRARRMLRAIEGPEAAFLAVYAEAESDGHHDPVTLVCQYGPQRMKRWASKRAQAYESVAARFPDSPYARRALVQAADWRAREYRKPDWR